MVTDRDDFAIAFRSAFLKKGAQQKFSLFILIDKAIPTEIGKTPPTIAEENILCFGKHKDIDLPFKIEFINSFSGTPTDLVEAINSKTTTGFSIAMAIALG